MSVLPAPLVPLRTGIDRDHGVPTKGTPGALGDTWHGLVNALSTSCQDAVVRHRGAPGRADLDALGEGDAERGGVQGPRAATRRSTSRRSDFFGLAVNFTPTWFQVFPGVDLLAPVTWSRGDLNGNAAVFLGGNEDGGNWSAGIAADIYSKYRIDLKYTGYFGDYSTNPTTARRRRRAGVPNGANSVRSSDRGWVSLTFKTTF